MSRRTATADAHGLGDPRIPWTILLDVTLRKQLAESALSASLAAIAAEQGWPTPTAAATLREYDDLPLALTGLAALEGLPVALGVTPGHLIIRADHHAVDGLGLLGVLARLTGTAATSAARGVTRAPPSGVPLRALASRLVEVCARPQAVIAPSLSSASAADVLVRRTVPGSPRTADLVVAGVRTVQQWNGQRHRRASRISVAVGVSTRSGSRPDVADRSGFLRLREVETMSASTVADALRSAVLQPGGGTAAPSALGRLARTASRLAAPRLGSTLLVSHLGQVQAGAATDLAFYPVTGGGSGLALGAVSIGGHTTLTLRARGSQHSVEGLEQLLETLNRHLPA